MSMRAVSRPRPKAFSRTYLLSGGAVQKRKALVAACLLLLATSGCTEQKARAVQVAAENFYSEATVAIGKVRGLFLASTTSAGAAPNEELARIVKEMGQGDLTAATFVELMRGPTLRNPATAQVEQEFAKLEQTYAAFAAMYESLPRGHLFAKDAVKKSEKPAIKLTLQMIHMANHVGAHPYPFLSRHALLIARINEARTIPDEGARKTSLAALAEEVLQLREEESRAHREAVQQCLKAAEAGHRVSGLIRDYDKLSLGEMLGFIRDTFATVQELSGNAADIKTLLSKYNAVKRSIEADPYWRPLLDLPLTGNEGRPNAPPTN